MNFKINFTPFFEKEFKKLYKKHRSLKSDLTVLIGHLIEDPQTGESIGNNCYKIRMSISSKGKGKSGGARIITHVRFINEEVFLISIYDKSEISTIAEQELLTRLKNII
ncbi:MAG: type II toxin-antitoxin system RelE/ParE family toxin [Bacteroidota bacterium]|jgi:mRNA-degrading endonuclease RelE of RelBE toxin-antitoxin system